MHDLHVKDKHTELLTFDYALTRIQIKVVTGPESGGACAEDLQQRPSQVVPHCYYVDARIAVVFRAVEAVRKRPATQVLLQIAKSVDEAISIIETATPCRMNA